MRGVEEGVAEWAGRTEAAVGSAVAHAAAAAVAAAAAESFAAAEWRSGGWWGVPSAVAGAGRASGPVG